MAVDEASFNTTMFSISPWLNDRNMSDDTGEPSRINKGVFDELIELIPLIRIDTVDIGSPVLDMTCKPATCPWRASAAFAVGLSLSFEPETDAVEPTTEDIFLAVPYPTTMASSSISASAFMVTLMIACPFTGTSTVTYPMKLNWSTASLGADME